MNVIDLGRLCCAGALAAALAGWAGVARADSCDVSVMPAEFDPVIGERWLISYAGTDSVAGVVITVEYYWLTGAGDGAWTSATLETNFPSGTTQQFSYGYTHGPIGDFRITAENCR